MPDFALPYQNTLYNDGWGRVADIQFGGAGTTFAIEERLPGEQQKPLVDGWGRLYVLSTAVEPDWPVTNQAGSGATLVNAAIIEAAPTKLISVAGYNSDTATNLYVQLYNTLVPPVGPVTPEIIIPVPMNKVAFSYSLPWIFTVGCVIVISTTELTYTAPAAPCLHYTCIFQTAS